MRTTITLHDVVKIEVGIDHRVGNLDTRMRTVTFYCADGSSFEADAFGNKNCPVSIRIVPGFKAFAYYDEPEPDPDPRADEANERGDGKNSVENSVANFLEDAS